ncbi:MAG: Nramp family divalent metal transporter [Rubrobacteraceae bacterium]|nr:Nramp family divalent metal transporter [Rubrobacteraceae bacterium]
MGMGARIPNIVSPITGEEEAAPGLGYTFPTNEENLRRWKRWWRICNQEQFFLFYVIGLLSLLALSVLAFSTLGIQENVGTDLAFIKDEGNVLADVIAPWFATFFFAAASITPWSEPHVRS